MDLQQIKALTPGLNDKSHAEKIKIFGWYIHVCLRRDNFQPRDIGDCYAQLHLNAPSSWGGYFQQLANSKELLKNGAGYRLSAGIRDDLAAKYSQTGHKVHVAKLLRDLPAKLPNLAERTFLDETLICYENGAFRATIVMAWNLAYHHLCDFVLKYRLTEFNARWLVSRPGDHKKGNRSIASMDDINQELKEKSFVEICKDAGIISKEIWKILDQKLDRRNSAAHPSTANIGQLQADEFIDDIVKNVVLKIA